MGAPKSTGRKSLDELFAGIPRSVLERLAGQKILERISPREAYKLRFVVAQYAEGHALVAAARILERLLAQGPLQVARGQVKSDAWQEGLRRVRLKLRDLAGALEETGREWKLRLSARERASLEIARGDGAPGPAPDAEELGAPDLPNDPTYYDKLCPCGSSFEYKDCCGYVAWKWERAAEGGTSPGTLEATGGEPITHQSTMRLAGPPEGYTFKSVACPSCHAPALTIEAHQICPTHIRLVLLCSTPRCLWFEEVRDPGDAGDGPAIEREGERAKRFRRPF